MRTTPFLSALGLVCALALTAFVLRAATGVTAATFPFVIPWHGQPQWSVQNWNGQTSVRLIYPARFTKSDSTVSLVFVESDGDYRVYDARYEF